MKLTLGFSPCPNDTFIFDALVNKKINTLGLEFEVVLDDVQTLNHWAKQSKLDITKISYGVLPLVLPVYQLLQSGGALGNGVGPLLIAKDAAVLTNINAASIAIPGENTTAHLLFSMVYPQAHNKQFRVFHEIENAVLSGEFDAGVIIHENRFTYQQKGLIKLMDLGDYWEQQLQVPIPLGGIVAKKSLPPELINQVDKLIQKSVQFAFANYPQLPDYVRQHAQEMDESVMKQHIDLYVNHFSLGLGEAGNKAVQTLIKVWEDIYVTGR